MSASSQQNEKPLRNPIMDIILALLVGLVVGIIFSACKLPLPAPPVLAGVMGIVGIYLGGHAWTYLSKMFFS